MPAADNTLTPEEAKQGWTLLFDGKSMRGWQDPAKKNAPGDAWEIRDGCLKTRLNPRIEEDLVSEESYGDFELQYGWKLPLAGNTGVKYRIQGTVFVASSKQQTGPGGFEGLLGREMAGGFSERSKLAPGERAFVYTVGFECQLIDDERHRDALKDARHLTGALYSMLAPAKRAARPAGEWNSGKVRVKGDRFEHWVNGVMVLEGSLGDPAIRQGAEKRWGPAPQVKEMLTHPKPRGPVGLQHHGDEVWFKNIKVRRLD
jgi:hypothetical protein